MRHRVLVPVLSAVALLVLGTVPVGATVVTAGNGIYTISVNDSVGGGDCGPWTAVTGALHPVGPGQNVLYGGGYPGTSNAILRSWTSGNSYATDSYPAGGCLSLCSVGGPPARSDVYRDGIQTGVQLAWTIADGGTTLQFVQLINVEGPVDGTETVDNTVIRESHTVRNLGSVAVDIGVRKMWDWQIGYDDGPWFGECSNPDAACDHSMNLTADGSESGPYPPAYIINEDPLVATCPPGITPYVPNCTGIPIYKVAATVAGGPLTPYPPDMVQFNSWGSLVSSCWEPTLYDNANCSGGDTALAYFYGRTAATAIRMEPITEIDFTQYVVAALDACPPVFEPEGVCTPRTHGFWHRYCLGQDAIDPGRFGVGIGPDPRRIDDTLPGNTIAVADAVMASYGLTACQALDDGPFSDELMAALRELATMHLNVAGGYLKRGCAVELHPIERAPGLTVADAMTAVTDRIAVGTRRSLREARWIGAHVNNGEALLPVDE